MFKQKISIYLFQDKQSVIKYQTIFKQIILPSIFSLLFVEFSMVKNVVAQVKLINLLILLRI